VSDRVILIVDDEQAQRTVLAGFLRKRGFVVLQAASVPDGLAEVAGRTADLVLADLRMPSGTGLDLLEGVRAVNPEVPVVVMTAFGTVASAVDAMKRGAADYLTKPIDLDELEVLIARTLERRALVAENRELRRQLETRYRLAGLETANPRMAGAINDVRVIAATNRDLEAMVARGDFRDDLYYRVNVVSVEIPPLRERREDIPTLVDHFLRRFAGETQAPVRVISREAMDVLVKYHYPGNVRELENVIHRAVVLARDATITTADLPIRVSQAAVAGAGLTSDATSFVERVREFERTLIVEALDRANGVQTRAARALGMSERHLRYKLQKYHLNAGSAGEAES
jgi:DNA-binding NtrC family response regulator